MPSTYSPSSRFEKPADGEQNATWGDTLNRNFDLIDEALSFATTITLTGTTHTLTANNGAGDEARVPLIYFGGNPAGPVTVTVPSCPKLTKFVNYTLQPLTLTTSGGSATYTLAAYTAASVYCDGASVYLQEQGCQRQMPPMSVGGGFGAYHIPGSVYGVYQATVSAPSTLKPTAPFTYSLLCTDNVIAVAFYAISDRRKKTDIVSLDAATCGARIDDLAGLARSFTFRDDGRCKDGWIAQDLIRGGFGDFVSLVPDADMIEERDEDGFVSPAGGKFVVDHEAILPALVVAVAELRADLAELRTRAARPWWRRLFG